MNWLAEHINTVLHGDCRSVLAQMPDGVIQTVCTSPPYWSLRDYGVEPTVWDGDSECQHVWGNKLELHDVREESIHGKSRTTDRFYGDESRRFNGNHQKHISGQFCQLCGAWRGALGLEPDPSMYIGHLVDIFREVRRVLRNDGTVWLNIADSYASSPSGNPTYKNWETGGIKDASKDYIPRSTVVSGLKPKDLCLIPERLAIAIQEDGWYIRCRIPWVKVNSMPSSQKDRPTVSHEYIFLMSKAKRYYYDQEAVKVPYTKPLDRWGGDNLKAKGVSRWNDGTGQEAYRDRDMRPDKAGRYRRTTDWWFDSLSDLFSDEFLAFVLPTEPFTMEMCQKCKQVYNRKEYRKLGILIIPAEESDTGREQKKRICAGCGSTDDWLSHFATFGEKLVTPMILAGTSPKACPNCGAGWKRVVENPKGFQTRKQYIPGSGFRRTGKALDADYRGIGYSRGQTLGWQPTCQCENNDGSGHAVVLDPFAGSGTTCAVAKKLGRAYVGIEQNADYCILAEKRIEETEIEPKDDRQLDMFQEAAGD